MLQPLDFLHQSHHLSAQLRHHLFQHGTTRFLLDLWFTWHWQLLGSYLLAQQFPLRTFTLRTFLLILLLHELHPFSFQCQSLACSFHFVTCETCIISCSTCITSTLSLLCSETTCIREEAVPFHGAELWSNQR